MSLARAILAAGPQDSHSHTRPTLSHILEIPEPEFVAHLRSQDFHVAEQAFDTLYRTFHGRLIAIARTYVERASAEELVQDVLGRVWERRVTLSTETPIGIYLYTAIRNAAISAKRHDRVVTNVEYDNREQGIALGTMGVPADEEVERQDVLAVIEQGLSRLPEGMRTAFSLRWIHEISYPEIAEIMAISEAAARKQVSRAREAIVPLLKRFVTE